MPGARVNFGAETEPSPDAAERPPASRPAASAPLLPGVSPTGDVEVPEPPDFAVVSVIN
jgi:hypothetical protein